MANFGVKLDGLGMLVIAATAVTAYVIISKRKLFTETLNPLSDQNLVYNATGANTNISVQSSNDSFFRFVDRIFGNTERANANAEFYRYKL